MIQINFFIIEIYPTKYIIKNSKKSDSQLEMFFIDVNLISKLILNNKSQTGLKLKLNKIEKNVQTDEQLKKVVFL